MPQNAPFWMQVKKKFHIPPFYHVATSNFNSACSIHSYWIPCEISLKTVVLLFQTCYHVVAQILEEVGNYLLK
jgi:hypothetical protein